MEPTTRERLHEKADIFSGLPRAAEVATARQPRMSREEKLRRWNDLLRVQPDRVLSTFPGIEHLEPEARDAQRCDDSAITVAFEDPVLRHAGLSDDSYGTARRFFELSDRDLHRIVCYCHHGVSTYAVCVAYSIRHAHLLTDRPKAPRFGMLTRVWQALSRRSLSGAPGGL